LGTAPCRGKYSGRRGSAKAELPADSEQLSAVSEQQSALSIQPSVISGQRNGAILQDVACSRQRATERVWTRLANPIRRGRASGLREGSAPIPRAAWDRCKSRCPTRSPRPW